jgi:hypothetical protein
MKSTPRLKRKPVDVFASTFRQVCHVTGLKPEKGVLAALLKRQAKAEGTK